MIDLGEISAIQKGQRINSTLCKKQEPRRQGKQPTRKMGSESAPERTLANRHAKGQPTSLSTEEM